MIDSKQIQNIKRETLAMKSVNDWLNQIEKIGNKRGSFGPIGAAGFNPMQSPEPSIGDKMLKMMEKKQEMELMTKMMGDFMDTKGKETTPKKESPQSKIMSAFASLMATNPEKATEWLENLDEKTISKLAMLNDPDPNAVLMRSLLEGKGGEKPQQSNLNDMLQVFQTLNKLNNDSKPQEDTNSKMFIEMMKLMVTQNNSNNKNPQENATIVLLQEMMRNEREGRVAAQQQAQTSQQENNNLMMRYLQEKNNELHGRPSASDEFIHMLGAIGQVKDGFGSMLGGPVTDKEIRKMEMDNDKWRFEKEIERDQRNTMFSLLSGIGDKIADAVTSPVGEELRAQFADKARVVGSELDTLNPNPVEQDRVVEQVNDEIIPPSGRKNFVVYGEPKQ